MQQNFQQTFKLQTYNILAECLTDKTEQYPNTRYPYCPPEFLEFKYRSKLILEDLQNNNPDIFCYQEIDNIEFYGQYFEKYGYKYEYMEKSDRKEGIAIGFKLDKFKLLYKNQFLYNQEIPEEISDKKHYKEQNQGILHFKLQDLTNEKNILNILTTHLHHDPFQDHVKYFQICRALQYIDQIQEKGQSTIFCGDFNSMPYSNVIQLIENKKQPDESRIDPKFKEKIKYQDYPILYEKIGSKYLNNNLKSAFCQYQNQNYPKFTNYKDIFQENIDYIFYDSNNIEITKLFNLIKEEDILQYGKGIPNQKYPSDHIPLIINFNFKNNN